MSDSRTAHEPRPLADRMRPQRLDEFVGQSHLLAPGKPLYAALAQGHVHSMILWGPPGVGKTTLARLAASASDAEFIALSAVMAGVKDIRIAVARAREVRKEHGRATILFLDEVHRFNKAQQDAFLPYVEDGTLIFIGATTENPSFEVNNALLSRARTYVLKQLTSAAVRQVIDRALTDSQRGLGALGLEMSEELRDEVAAAADGDARRALNWLEQAADLVKETAKVHISKTIVEAVIAEGMRRFDKGGDLFYDQISALHKSVRGSAPNAALYWLVRMLDGGCDPLYIARRILRMASEDIGNADPRGLSLALTAWEVQERLGSPEGELAVAQAVVYLACAPKSNALYKAFKSAQADVGKYGSAQVPLHLRNAPTHLMKKLGHGHGYRYAHDEPEGYAAGERYFPDTMPERHYYQPVGRGLEIKIAEKLAALRARDRNAQNDEMEG